MLQKCRIFRLSDHFCCQFQLVLEQRVVISFRESNIEIQRIVTIAIEAGQIGRNVENENQESLHGFFSFEQTLVVYKGKLMSVFTE